MATSNGLPPEQQFGNVLAALATMQSNTDRTQKHQATEYLEQFQKSIEAWNFGYVVLQSETISVEAKLFAASTLKGKITYDIHQLPPDQLVALRDSLITLLVAYRTGARPIRTQLCVCLAGLALQMLEWKDVIDLVVRALGNDATGLIVLLEFLTVLPEEVMEGRKISLSEEQLFQRTGELLTDNAPKVLQILVQYARVTGLDKPTPALISCLNSWLREIPCKDVVNTELLQSLFTALSGDDAFDEAVDCLCTMFRETREVDACSDVIEKLYPGLIALRPRITKAVADEDTDAFKGLTRLFAEAGEAWVLLAVKYPNAIKGDEPHRKEFKHGYRELVDVIEECAKMDEGRDVISLTFNFWYDLKNYLVLDTYQSAREVYQVTFERLVDIMINHLQYPEGNKDDLFEGDREQEEKFREFRHAMGDVLKDCCEVIGATTCLKKAYSQIEIWMKNYISQTPETQLKFQNWQGLEAPLFSLRAMGRMVPSDEETVLPQIMQMLVKLPEHEKVRFAATLVLGRYTEWTAKHPQYLEPQVEYVSNGFQHGSKDIAQAAAMAMKFFCQDCSKLLVDRIALLHTFYQNVAPNLPLHSLYELTDGMAHVVASQTTSEGIYSSLKLFCDPISQRLMIKAQEAGTDNDKKCKLADEIQLLTIFAQIVHPHIKADINPMIEFWKTVIPMLSNILDAYVDFLPICEQVGRFYRSLLISYRTDMKELLPEIAVKLSSSFQQSHQGIFLWVTGTVIREFSNEDDIKDEAARLLIRNTIYQLMEQQCVTMFRLLNNTHPKEIPDVIEDFFRFLTDGIMFHPDRIVMSNLLETIIEASLVSLDLQKTEPLLAVLQFLRDLFAYGRPAPPNSTYRETPIEIRKRVALAAASLGERITQRILSGLMYSFPSDCVTDSSGVMLELVHLCPAQMIQWIKSTLELLPAGSITPTEAQNFLGNVETAAAGEDWNKIRYTLRDFTAWYRRKNVTPRSQLLGIAGTELPRFRFGG
ncbi:armadillo-type protein [Pyronema omphalodes]|nr:armadillo-type protein [Pyronema omphalodes]